MAIWKDQSSNRSDTATLTPEPLTRKEPELRPDLPANYSAPRKPEQRETKESLIASDITIEGKIEGSGHVRIAGQFKGDVNVQGNLAIEVGAKLTGNVRANTVTIAGEMEGNIDAASRVELLDTGVLNGDLTAGSLTVAAGSRMRGRVEFGWAEKSLKTPNMKLETGSAA